MGSHPQLQDKKLVAHCRNVDKPTFHFSDLTFLCHDEDLGFPSIYQINAHQAIFSNLSEMLKMLFSIGHQKQPYERIYINVDSANPIVLEKLVEYIYEGKTYVDENQQQQLIEICKRLQLELPLTDWDITAQCTQTTRATIRGDAITDSETHPMMVLREITNTDLHTHWKDANNELLLSPKKESDTLTSSVIDRYVNENLMDQVTHHINKKILNKNVELPTKPTVEVDSQTLNQSINESGSGQKSSSYLIEKESSPSRFITPDSTMQNPATNSSMRDYLPPKKGYKISSQEDIYDWQNNKSADLKSPTVKSKKRFLLKTPNSKR